jgi:glyoxylase-like metal-dependent hydrolase (beta-lactamase superfamily II)
MSDGLPRWTPMNSAHYLVDRSLMVANRDPGVSVRITTTWSVLEHPAGVVVIDTGVAPETAATSWQARDRSPGQPVMAPGGTVTARLAALGIRCSDVRYVVNTHLHLDHTGGNRELAGAAFLTRAAELAYAREPDVPSLALEYSTDQIAESRLRYVCVEGDHDVFGDGCLTLVPSPGHSAGHQSALLRLPDSRQRADHRRRHLDARLHRRPDAAGGAQLALGLRRLAAPAAGTCPRPRRPSVLQPRAEHVRGRRLAGGTAPAMRPSRIT